MLWLLQHTAQPCRAEYWQHVASRKATGAIEVLEEEMYCQDLCNMLSCTAEMVAEMLQQHDKQRGPADGSMQERFASAKI